MIRVYILPWMAFVGKRYRCTLNKINENVTTFRHEQTYSIRKHKYCVQFRRYGLIENVTDGQSTQAFSLNMGTKHFWGASKGYGCVNIPKETRLPSSNNRVHSVHNHVIHFSVVLIYEMESNTRTWFHYRKQKPSHTNLHTGTRLHVYTATCSVASDHVKQATPLVHL